MRSAILYYWSKFTLWMLGWEVKGELPPEVKKCIIVVAPHTSMTDFIIGRFAFWYLRIKVSFLIKKEAFTFWVGWLIRGSGGIPVDRRKGSDVTNHIVTLIEKSERIAIVITPEGTREKVTHWKRGFYFLAETARIPIALAYIDYGKKKGGIMTVIHPSGDYNADMLRIKEFYRGMVGKHPDCWDIESVK
jgi:1-acyl-sn-glycerol-3-phosphate acyltransferase